jgi:hypothetical protein
MRSQRGLGRYLGALIGPMILAGLLIGLSPAAPVPACRTWTAVPPLNPGTQDNELESVNVLSGSDVWAVGVSHDSGPEQTLTEHWDGSSWVVEPSPDPGGGNNFLFAVRAASPVSVWAVGSFEDTSGLKVVTKSLILRWDGTSWSQVPSPSPGNLDFLEGVGATSTSNAWAVGITSAKDTADQTLILHWNGTAWKRVRSPDPVGRDSDNDLFGVATTATNTAWAVGSVDDSNNAQHALLLRWDGTSWQQVRIPPSGDRSGLSGVGASSSGNAWAVGTDVSDTTGQTLALHCS